MVASDTGNVEVVDKLLQHGATVDLQHQVMIMHMPIIEQSSARIAYVHYHQSF